MQRPSLLRAATIVSAAFVASRALGLLREVVISAQFGTSAELDAYLAAFRIPDILFQLIAGGALGSAFIPTFAAYLARDDEPGAQALATTVINLVLGLLSAVALIIALAAPWLVSVIVAPGFTPAQQALTVSLMRLMLVSTVIFGVSGIVMGVLNARQHFLLPALAPVVYNLAITGGALLLGPSLGVAGLALGVVAGAAGHLLIQVPALMRAHFHWSSAVDLRHPGVHAVARLMGPRVVGLAITQLNFLVNTILASGLAAGSLAALNYAWLLMLLPQGIIAQAMATALFPTLAAQSARGETTALRATLSSSLRGLLFFMLPAAVGLMVAGGPLVAVLLQRGRFGADSTALTVYALQFYALGLVGHAVLEIVTRGFYALHDTRTPVMIGVAAMALNLLLSLLLIGPLSFGGLALANSIATLLEAAAITWLLRARLGGLDGRALSGAAWRMALAAVVMGACLAGFLALAPGLNLWLSALGCLSIGGAAYLGAAYALRIDELRRVPQLLRRR
ncbi:MAG: murein biosynthesis integral membrane protein MurJ [Chloroflexi bacterium]|nr:murein biosynthesis integral membrane protein MurJ [Chloroflexota bacterium]